MRLSSFALVRWQLFTGTLHLHHEPLQLEARWCTGDALKILVKLKIDLKMQKRQCEKKS
jgi:hypothetical protein